ncbi:serine/threonine-protein kinase [Streptomyces naganishii]|uniref:non-specific serine/threonine protein kinase n=1 Tax=Streptomyces naganishii JCM 4654 TaxID=1306179 RepID=A0A918Y9Y4_9ACTN|nr:serine/threonine-protein kinase [Streptomyces naganishii]GHD94476.1 serine/threonine protein kinase [Streptomyces naganishii JCM 4654]
MSEAERGGASRRNTRQDTLQGRSERLLAGRYRLGDVLGRGGMGTVWRAEDETLGRTVAVKELRFPANIDEDEKRRLITRTLREAKAIARIRNTSAVTVFDVVDEDDRPWIVMELVEGKSLAEVIREDGLLEPRRAAEVGLAVLDVLRSAHRQGILHRDVKPSNVLIAEDGRVVLTDFGIAQVEGDPSITSTGMLVGAPSYISPERARGHKPGPAADLWSLGGLLYAAVEGTPPYDKGSAIATLTAVMTEPLGEPKNAGPLRDVIHGLLNKDPDKRLDDAGARAMLNAVIHAPDPKEAEPEPPADATRVVPLPARPDSRDEPGKAARSGAPGGGGKRGEEAGERLRGALRSVRKAAVAAGAATSAAASRTKPAAGGAGSGAVGAAGAAGAGTSASVAAPAAKPSPASSSPSVSPAAPDPAVAPVDASAGRTGKDGKGGPAGGAASSGAGAGAGTGDAATTAVGGVQGGRTRSGWPVMPPPDLDLAPRPVPRAPLTDVVPRRTLVIIAVVVALAVIGAVLALTLNGDDKGSKGSRSGAARASTTAGASASASTKEDTTGGTGTDGKQADAENGTAGPGGSPAASTASGGQGDGSGDGSGGSGPDGGGSKDDGAATTYKSSQGFTIGLPKGWKYASTDSAGVRFTGPDGQKLLVAWTSSPKDDPVADWKNQEGYMVRSQYQRIRIEQVGYRGWNAADWEFTYVDGGTEYRTVDRGFVVNGHLGYALMYTAKSANWDTDLRRNTWRTLTKTFEPKS